jgi:hypothetical protein
MNNIFQLGSSDGKKIGVEHAKGTEDISPPGPNSNMVLLCRSSGGVTCMPMNIVRVHSRNLHLYG